MAGVGGPEEQQEDGGQAGMVVCLQDYHQHCGGRPGEDAKPRAIKVRVVGTMTVIKQQPGD